MGEPKYDEDAVNLGYLKKVINNEVEDIETIINKNYMTQPKPPYYAGDTWTDEDVVYTCINTRLVGLYVPSDWVTESGAKEEAKEKNKIFLTQPSNYSPGDMWILQTDDDHRSGKKGEILISTVGREKYDADDWINMLGYGTIRSINEVAENLNDALKRLELNKEEKLTIYYKSNIPEDIKENDLWYVTDNIDIYEKGKLYKYSGENWNIVENEQVISAFEEANEARLVSDEKIVSFYCEEQPTNEISAVGDIWTNEINNRLYRYNGTNWVAVYDTNLNEIREEIEWVIEVKTEISTDLGKITQRVEETETTTKTIENKMAQQEITVNGIKNEVSSTNAKINELEERKSKFWWL